MRILIVDADVTEAAHLRGLLANEDVIVDIAADIAEADAMQGAAPYDAAFLATQLPDGDLAASIRPFYKGRCGITACPVVMLAGRGEEAAMVDALRLGAQDYVMRGETNGEGLALTLHKVRETHQLRCAHAAAEVELMQHRKMEAIGQLTSGIAHDFNNLLTVVIGNAHLLRRRFEAGVEKYGPEDIAEKFDAISDVCESGSEMVRRLMVFTRQRALEKTVADVNAVIRDTMALLERALGGGIEIETPLGADIWPVAVDVVEFQNTLINFAVNARDAMEGTGRLTIETENVTLGDSYVMRHGAAQPGRYVMIAISDTGCGMVPEVTARIFEPFFTTKPSGEGTGLGLAMAYGFVRQSGGHITVYSEKGHGTVFRLYLPAASAEAAQDVGDDDMMMVSQSGRERILVVEDDTELRGFVVHLLERMGYRTLQAPNGRVALEILRREHERIDLVFSDVVMPGPMNGVELAEQVRRHFPQVKILLTSGYSEKALPLDLVREPVISKPYRREALAARLRAIFDKVPEHA
ncbi:MAG: response regulator [Alphaproteobacteria bacterium]|nr:response regulator [Alphaproteobacteria bacterium]USO08364.1 MAG: response regulator [Rhodospirillales bacterium]